MRRMSDVFSSKVNNLHSAEQICMWCVRGEGVHISCVRALRKSTEPLFFIIIIIKAYIHNAFFLPLLSLKLNKKNAS